MPGPKPSLTVNKKPPMIAH